MSHRATYWRSTQPEMPGRLEEEGDQGDLCDWRREFYEEIKEVMGDQILSSFLSH